MSIRVVFLGTSGAIPTLQRSLPAVIIQRGNEMFMLDCGESVQRQMLKAKVGFQRITKIFISHLHGDHVLGLPGLLQSMALMNRKRSIDVYGPEGIAAFLTGVQEALHFGLTFDVQIREIHDAGTVCDETDYTMTAAWTNHVTPTLAYAFLEKTRPGKFFPEKAESLGIPKGILWSRLQHGKAVTLPNGKVVRSDQVTGPKRRGRKIVYSGDTRPFEEFAKFAKGADLLIHEATFEDALADKADLDGHSTPSQAATQAKSAKVGKLVLTHISARYNDVGVLLEQARKIFPNTSVASDFLVLNLPLCE
jgi:ribonuclease Z